MSRAARPRRTRVYDCNYNIGESYYKPVLDRVDRKYSGRPEVETRPRPTFDEPETQHTFDDIFDSRGGRAQRGRPLSTAIEEDFDSEISDSLKRLRANKKTSRFAEDVEFDNALSNFENRSRISDKILESVGISNSEMSSARRALAENEERTEKRIARRLKEDDSSLTKWTTLKSIDDESAASQRAKASRARLTDLEDEMTEMNERTAAREKRAARLRALVAENEADSATTAKISIRSEKKQVTF